MLESILWTILWVSIIGTLVFFVSGNKKRVFQVMSGWGIYQFLSAIYDYPFWTFMQYQYGIWGSVICTIGALLINLYLIIWYQKSGSDWLGVRIFEKLKEQGEEWSQKVFHKRKKLIKYILYIPAKLISLLISTLNKNDILAFFFFSIWQDPFITTNFLRHGYFGKLRKKDYLIFILSSIVTSIFWSVIIGIFVKLIKLIFI